MKNDSDASAQSLLLHEHKKISGLFKEYGQASDPKSKEDVVQNLSMELHIHMMLEEQVLFPALEKEGRSKKLLAEAQNENNEIKCVLDQLQRMMADQDNKEYDKKVGELEKCVDRHISQSEKKLLLKAENAGLDMEELANDICKKKDNLTGTAAVTSQEALEPRHCYQPEHQR